MRNLKVKSMTLDAIFIALMIVVNFLQFGFILLFPQFFTITILHIIVIIVALLGGYKRSWVLGLTFGLLSLIMSFINPYKGALDWLFNYPHISVLPRLLFGLISGFLAQLFIKRFENNRVGLLAYSAVIAVVLTAIHTILTIGSIYIFFNEVAVTEISPDFIYFISILLSTNGAIEMLLAGVVVPAVVVPLYKYSRQFYEPLEANRS